MQRTRRMMASKHGKKPALDSPEQLVLWAGTRDPFKIAEKLEIPVIHKNHPESGLPGLTCLMSSRPAIFINDAYGTCHRAHASNVGIAKHLPNGVGFLVEKELKIIGNAIENPKRPFTVILGGSKVSDKIGVIENLVKIADNILIGGGMAFTFLKSQNIEIGKSLLDEENIEFCKNILKQNEGKILLPIDVVTSTNVDKTENKKDK